MVFLWCDATLNNLYLEQSLLIHSIFNHDIGISSKCHMIGSKSRSLFYVTCSPREEFNLRLILCGYALRRVTKKLDKYW